jgi:predicted PurR-regulated permease PerM
MLPWYIVALFVVIAVGSMLSSFWASAMLSCILTVCSFPAVRRRVNDKIRLPLHDHYSTVGLAFVALVAIGMVCEWELQSRISEFESRQSTIFAQANQALETDEFSEVYALAERYNIIPGQPFEPFIERAQVKEEEAFQNTLEGRAQRSLKEYRRQKNEQESKVDSYSEGDQ